MAIEEILDAWIYGTEIVCDAAKPERPFHCVLLGAPGAGKGTQAQRLSDKLGAVQFSTGDVFRAARATHKDDLSPVMKAALDRIDEGHLASDELVIAMVAERANCLASGYGFLLDGFPRTVNQAEALTDILEANNVHLDAVLNYVLTLEDVVQRLGGRRTCRKCRATFHVTFDPPKSEGVCDNCGGELFQRDDDKAESVEVRLEEYHASTALLTAYYETRELLVNVSAEGCPDEVFERTLAAMGW